MAIVGLTSPFKIKGEDDSPFNFAAAPLIGAGLNFLASQSARRDARRRDREARRRLAEAREAYNKIEFTNPYEGITNPYADVQSQFTGMENIYEEAQVDTRAADYMREQSQQQQANLLNQLRGTAGGSGVAGLAQQLSNIGTQQARQASLNIAAQERASEEQRRREASRIDMLQRGDAQRIDMLRRQGDYDADMLQRKGDLYVQQQEQRRIESLYGLAADRQTATSQALASAGQSQSAALGNLVTAGLNYFGGVGGGGGIDTGGLPVGYGGAQTQAGYDYFNS